MLIRYRIGWPGMLKTEYIIDCSPLQKVSFIHTHLFVTHRFFTNPQSEQLLVGSLAQLAEHCTAIADVICLRSKRSWTKYGAARRSFCIQDTQKMAPPLPRLFCSRSIFRVSWMRKLLLVALYLCSPCKGTLATQAKTSWVQLLYKPEFFQALLSLLLR